MNHVFINAPNAKVILDHLARYPSTAPELAWIYGISLTHVRDIVRQLRREKRIVVSGKWCGRAPIYQAAPRQPAPSCTAVPAKAA